MENGPSPPEPVCSALRGLDNMDIGSVPPPVASLRRRSATISAQAGARAAGFWRTLAWALCVCVAVGWVAANAFAPALEEAPIASLPRQLPTPRDAGRVQPRSQPQAEPQHTPPHGVGGADASPGTHSQSSRSSAPPTQRLVKQGVEAATPQSLPRAAPMPKPSTQGHYDDLVRLLKGGQTGDVTFARLRHAATGRKPRAISAQAESALASWMSMQRMTCARNRSASSVQQESHQGDGPALQWSCEGPKVCGGLGDRLLVRCQHSCNTVCSRSQHKFVLGHRASCRHGGSRF